MSFFSPVPGSKASASPGQLVPLQLGLFASPMALDQVGLRDGRLSLEKAGLGLQLLEEATNSQASSQEEALEVFSKAGLAKAPSAKQLDAFAPRPATGVEDKQAVEAAADSLTAKLLEQIMPGLKQHVQEALASGKGGLNLQEVLQMALQQEALQAASSMTEALPSALAKQLRDSQEMSMAGSICAPKTEQHGTQPDPQAKMGSTSAASGSSGTDDDAEQQATSALKPGARLGRGDSAAVRALGLQPMELELEQAQEEDAAGAERPPKRVCQGAAEELPAAPAAALPPPGSALGPAPAFEVTAGAPAAAGGRKRRTNYVKMRELESSIQEARVVGQHLQQAIASAEQQYASVQEENRQLWNAVAHISATLHAGRASLLAPFSAHAAAPSPGALLPAVPVEPASAPAPVAAAAPAGALPPGMTPGGDLQMLVGSPDPLCLAEACGMLFSPAPAKLAPAVDAGAAGKAAVRPSNKPRKLFEEEMPCCGAGAEGAAASCDATLALEDMPAMPKLVGFAQ